MSSLPSIFLPRHNLATFNKLRGEGPNRICFATTHSNALKENGPSYAERHPFKFAVPFREGLGGEFFAGTGILLKESQYGFWTGLTSEEAERVRQWMRSQGTRVYQRDFFDCSISLGERSLGTQETELGRLFTAAKYTDSTEAKTEVLRRMKETWDQMRSLPKGGYVSCPPPRPGKNFDLPTALAERLAKYAGLKFASLGDWKGDKGELKDVPVDKKWRALEAVGFDVNPVIASSGGPILLIDDIYQSGITLNFLRASLTAKGVPRVSAMSIVKAARDTDNQNG